MKYDFSPRTLAVIPIVCYKRLISPFLPKACRFTPTCSAYAAEAIMTHGVFKGIYLALRRLMKCHPFGSSGYDPVPPLPAHKQQRESSK